MQYFGIYQSFLGEIFLTADEEGLTGLRFCEEKEFPALSNKGKGERKAPVIETAEMWLDQYFSGKEPAIAVPLHLTGTDFEREVWEIIRTVPYGKTACYREIAEAVARKRGVSHFSSQAVGGAAARNPVLLLIPCHRVIRADGTFGGYAGGTERKKALLILEAKGEIS